VACVNRVLEQLEDMKLITLDGFDPRDRANVSISKLKWFKDSHCKIALWEGGGQRGWGQGREGTWGQGREGTGEERSVWGGKGGWERVEREQKRRRGWVWGM